MKWDTLPVRSRKAIAIAGTLFIAQWASGYGLLVGETKGEKIEKRFGWESVTPFAECNYWIGFEVITWSSSLFVDDVKQFNCSRWKKVR
jgi:hypothetical protein